ncbi:hypothetical protein BS50DRAFT_615672 [Corynespora cassiicola Philippines]|uniref:Extracellular membrane protein CFEM domain-containing protein n=1 Tax=Corynespora cassiicola Philippines TaxID=1448308 RepID=A0A2T2PB36_CORCC|nr:hypothetical protein BS50DRAFT_615672 [Corynespora cassiicola Philippines]
MLIPKIQIVILATCVTVTSAVGPTSIFIDNVPEYDLLATCAELELSAIVRDMQYGCGDGSSLTSYACFCYQSSAKFSSMIGKHVETQCPQDPSQNTSAIEVFSKYCQLGQVAALPTATSSSTVLSISSVLPAPGVTTSIATSTSVPSQKQESKDTPVVAIAVGVSVPVATIAIAVSLYFLWRHRKSRLDIIGNDGEESKQTFEVSGSPQIGELGPFQRVELAQPTETYYELGTDQNKR